MKKNLSILLILFAQNINAQPGASTRLIHRFDSLLSADFKPSDPGGVVLISQKGTVIYRKAFGLADLEMEVPMRTNMVFNIASITKQFTAIAILQLAEQGKLALTDELIKYIPDYPVNENK